MMEMATLLFLGFIIAQRLSELVVVKRNTACLLDKGAYEVGAEHYPIMVGMHSLWIAGLLFLGYDESVAYGWIAIFEVLQMLRTWILGTLGSRWTMRAIILPEPLVIAGPFKYLNQLNYILVVAEIIVAPMVLSLTWVALVFTVLNAAMLYVRIGVDEKELSKLPSM